MNKKVLLTFLVLVVLCVEGRKTSRSRGSGSGRGSSRNTNYNPQPAPTSFSYPQQSAAKPSLFGWQEKPAQKTQTSQSRQPKPSNTQSHSYPSSNTGLSGSQPKQPPKYQETIQKTNVPSQQSAPRPGTQTNNQQGQSYPSSNGLSGSSGTQTNNQPGHSYPSSNGLSGSSGTSNSQQSGHAYPQGNQQQSHQYPQQQVHQTPQQQGHQYQQASGNTQHQGSGYPQQAHGFPQQQGVGYQQGTALSGPGAAPPPYSGYSGAGYQGNNYGNYHHPQGPPPPYSNFGSGYGGYGGHGSYGPNYGPQAPGYFGNYANSGKGFGGVSRGTSALTGVGIAGAGVGTLLTGLALWNLARSTGKPHHTVIYDNRGQPVAVAPDNNTASQTDSILADLVNCTLTISTDNATEILGIPCSIATSFTPDAEVKDVNKNDNSNDNTKCTVTVVTKAGREFMTTIPCSTLLNTAADNNVTEPAIPVNEPEGVNGTLPEPNQPTALRLTGDDLVNQNYTNMNLNCTPHPGDIRDPINPCYAITHNVTVLPLPTTDKIESNGTDK